MKRYSLSILCAAMIAGAITMFIEQRRVMTIRRQFASDSVRSDWNTARFVIRAHHNDMDWYYDLNDPVEAGVVEHLRRIYLLADSEGHVLQLSDPYQQLGLPLPATTNAELHVWESTSPSDSRQYLLCTGPIFGENGQHYQLTVGRQLD
jgi:hypothetical protein